MTTMPADPAPTPRELAAYLRQRAALAARRSVTLCAHDIELLIAAAALIEIAFMPVPVPAGEGAG